MAESTEPSTSADVEGRPVKAASGVVDVGRVAALSALFETGSDLVEGDDLPPLWHWAAMPAWHPLSASGADGHPRRDEPSGDAVRRMFAGGEVRMVRPLTVGERTSITTTVTNRTVKEGRSGRFELVTERTEIRDARSTLVVDERRDIVLRPPGPKGAPTTPVAPPPSEDAPPRLLRQVEPWRWNLVTHPTSLMRFSAATANSHRIHHDHPYATQVEGYPGLVVHGPLITMAMAEVLRREATEPALVITHRNLAPLFCGEEAVSARVTAPNGGSGVSLSSGDRLVAEMLVG